MPNIFQQFMGKARQAAQPSGLIPQYGNQISQLNDAIDEQYQGETREAQTVPQGFQAPQESQYVDPIDIPVPKARGVIGGNMSNLANRFGLAPSEDVAANAQREMAKARLVGMYTQSLGISPEQANDYVESMLPSVTDNEEVQQMKLKNIRESLPYGGPSRPPKAPALDIIPKTPKQPKQTFGTLNRKAVAPPEFRKNTMAGYVTDALKAQIIAKILESNQ